ncbi:MAG TPA: hypothetical protein VLJ39_09335 [Tepidisphaeraceae bacterium]|nr:hypothetical protein [Tepidisphaeraceae bacterium]
MDATIAKSAGPPMAGFSTLGVSLNPGREHLIGGGTFYDLTLADFPGQP